MDGSALSDFFSSGDITGWAVVAALAAVCAEHKLGREADAVLRRVGTWIAGHTSTLNAGLLRLIGAMQRQKALSALLGGE
ncbi:MAG TPA: hypothetical protein VIP54_00610 [Microterricola sp.]